VKRNGIVAHAGALRHQHGIGSIVGRVLVLVAALACAACYPRYDWRDVRPDCEKGWCGFVASFPGKIRSATRDVPVGSARVPLSVHVVSIGYVSFAVTAFDLTSGVDAGAARDVLEHKLLADVGAPVGRHGRVEMHAADHAVLAADTFDADGTIEGRPERASARFVERRGRLVEILVVGPVEELDKPTGRQAVETFFTSLRLD
jgi:hypothetical protein